MESFENVVKYTEGVLENFNDLVNEIKGIEDAIKETLQLKNQIATHCVQIEK